MANNTLLASDNFASGSLAAGWSVLPTLGFSSIVGGSPNVAEAPSVGTPGGQIWTGLTWPNDQISEVVINNLAGGSSSTTVGLVVRCQNSSPLNCYLAIINSAGSVFIYKDVAGTATPLTSAALTSAVAAGDVISFMAAGSCLSVYKNGILQVYFYNTIFTSGFPGFDQGAATTVGNSQVASWSGYSLAQADGVWTKQGIVIPGIAVDYSQATAGVGIQITNVLFDTNPQILAGPQVYKTWIVSDWTNDATSAMYYAESADGISWTRKSSAVLASVTNGYVHKFGSTYYMYGQASGSSGSGNQLVYTSADGITWALQSPSQVLTPGGGGAWDHFSFYNITSVFNIAGTLYGYYIADNGTGYQTGLATSTDAINWVKYVGNPVITTANYPGHLTSIIRGAIAQVGNTYYTWCTSSQGGQGGSTASLDPFEAVRFKSADGINWALDCHSLHHTQMYESLNYKQGGLIPAAILQVGNQSYMWCGSSMADSVSPQVGQVSLAIAPSTLAALVANREDATIQTATDAFTSGVGNLSSNWVTPTGATKLQIVSGNLVEATALSNACYQLYTGSTFGNDQYSEITLKTLTAPDFIGAMVRGQVGSRSYYSMEMGGPTGSSIPSFNIVKQINGGSAIVLGPTLACTPNVGDVFRLEVRGNVLSAYQNGFLLLQVEDNTFTSGYPGFFVYATDSLANSQVSLWAGGNANVGGGGPKVADLLLLGIG